MRMKVNLAILGCLLVVGCTSCPHRANFDCLGGDVCPNTTGCQRNSVVAIVMGPELDFGWCKLANKINEAGYARVLRGSTLQMPLVFEQARILFRDDDSVRFVVIGYDMGTIAAKEITSNLLSIGANVDHCVYLDPWTTVARQPLPPTVAITVVRSHGWRKGLFLDASDQIVPGVGHFDLPTHELTVAAIAEALKGSASSIVRESTHSSRPPDPTAPPMPNAVDRPSNLGSDWDFLLGPQANPSPSKPKVIPERTAKLPE